MALAGRRHADLGPSARHPGARGRPRAPGRPRPPLHEGRRGDLDALIEEAAAAHALMPKTATFLGVRDSLDPRQNVFGGVKYLGQLLDRFGGNVALALAGYNAGPTKVARHRGIPPYGETRRYVTRIRTLLAESTGALFPLPEPVVARKVRAAAIRRARAAQNMEPRRGKTPRRPRRTVLGRRS